MKLGTLFTIEDYSGSYTEFVGLYNKWQEATVFLSTGNCTGKEWDALIAYGKDHQDEVKDVLHEFLSLDDNIDNWMAMSVLESCCPEVGKSMKVEGYVQPKYIIKFILDFWDTIFNNKPLEYAQATEQNN